MQEPELPRGALVRHGMLDNDSLLYMDMAVEGAISPIKSVDCKVVLVWVSESPRKYHEPYNIFDHIMSEH